VTRPVTAAGLAQFKWWEDWRGQAVAIVACGPSAVPADVALLQNRIPVLAIKEAHTRLTPWCDVVYGCEAPWWQHVKGLPDYHGLKIAWSQAQIAFHGIHRFHIKDKTLDRILLEEPGIIGAGGHSGFQALNIAAQFGAARILLIGFDLHAKGGVHFYGRNTWQRANNPDGFAFLRWIAGLERAAVDLKHAGIEVVNASAGSAVKGFVHMTIQQAIEAWDL
jgi:hypothetical protein